MSLEAAQAEFRRCSGTQFDPAIVDAFAAAAAAGEIQLPTTMPISGEMPAIAASTSPAHERATATAQVLKAG
jgi:HD-GYP domain-containing protein (c-di-GMP phosphodiesterase class II)